jgi:hypothetical protein
LGSVSVFSFLSCTSLTKPDFQFERILALSQKPSWRTRGLQAAANLTGLDVTIPAQPYISPEVAKAFEKIGEGEGKTPVNYGSTIAWLAHLDIIRYVILSGFSTAFIIEDDVDWDVRIKDQIKLVSDNVRKFLKISDTDLNPYGTDWDVLWIGHCGEITDDSKEYVQYHDESRVTTENYSGWSKKYWMDHIPEGERRVQMTVNTVCTFGYGVTAEGARKILEKMSSGKDEAYDVGLQHKCKSGELRCVVVLPQVLNHYEASEKLGYKSDIKAKSGEGSSASDELLGKTMGTTQNMVQSARCKAQFNSECLAPGTPPDIYG